MSSPRTALALALLSGVASTCVLAGPALAEQAPSAPVPDAELPAVAGMWIVAICSAM